MPGQAREGPEHAHLTSEELDRLLAVDRTEEQNRNLFHQIAVRLRWAEGRIAAGLGRTEDARRIFEEIRREFIARDMFYAAALVTLELAALYIKEGRTSEVRNLAQEMIEIFRTQDVHREAFAALAVFHSAAVLETATVKLTREIASRLETERRYRG